MRLERRTPSLHPQGAGKKPCQPAHAAAGTRSGGRAVIWALHMAAHRFALQPGACLRAAGLHRRSARACACAGPHQRERAGAVRALVLYAGRAALAITEEHPRLPSRLHREHALRAQRAAEGGGEPGAAAGPPPRRVHARRSGARRRRRAACRLPGLRRRARARPHARRPQLQAQRAPGQHVQARAGLQGGRLRFQLLDAPQVGGHALLHGPVRQRLLCMCRREAAGRGAPGWRAGARARRPPPPAAAPGGA